MDINEIGSKVFEGKIVRKDLVSKIKGGANVPVYVLEYLLGMYCNQTDENKREREHLKNHFKLTILLYAFKE